MLPKNKAFWFRIKSFIDMIVFEVADKSDYF
jgi:hypothetical protein